MSLLNGFIGGTLVGTAAAVTLLGSGEIMGFSGIISSILKNPVKAAQDPSQQWKLVFLSTFLLSSYAFFLPVADQERIASVASITSGWAYGLSGLLVGFGTKLGNGCTSGHGICGMARRSRRSITAVLTFMAAAVATTVLTSPAQATGAHFEFLRSGAAYDHVPPLVIPSVIASLLGLTLFGAYTTKGKLSKQESRQRIPAAISGSIAAAGLSLGSMVYPAVVRSFLDLGAISRGTWDPTLMMVMTGGLLASFVSYQFVPGHSVAETSPKMQRSLAGKSFGVPTSTKIDWKLLLGALCFGTGWGLTGLCPGPALLLTTTGLSGMLMQWWPAYYVGMRLAEGVKENF